MTIAPRNLRPHRAKYRRVIAGVESAVSREVVSILRPCSWQAGEIGGVKEVPGAVA